MIGLLRQDKRGISPIIGYVLLIVIAMALAGGVYTYLTRYVPADTEQCPSDVRLSIESVNCTQGLLSITLVNRGLFTADGAYVRVGEIGRAAKTSLTSCSPSGCDLYFNSYDSIQYPNGLVPGGRVSYQKAYTRTGQQEIEIQPVVFGSGSTLTELLCTDAIVRQQVQCG